LVLTGKPEHKEFLEPFLSGKGEPLASLVFSEPGGVANYLEKGAPGLNTTAVKDGDEWVINGEKVHHPDSSCVQTWLIEETGLGYELCRLGFRRRRSPVRGLPQYHP
jgi:hypothetical protein